MRDLDLGPFLRLRGAIQQASDAIPDESGGVSGTALPKAYERFRKEALNIVPNGDREEFERLCPEGTTPLGEYPKGASAQAQTYSEAKVLLGTLSGFLDGYITETQMRLEAEATAARNAEGGGQYL